MIHSKFQIILSVKTRLMHAPSVAQDSQSRIHLAGDHGRNRAEPKVEVRQWREAGPVRDLHQRNDAPEGHARDFADAHDLRQALLEHVREALLGLGDLISDAGVAYVDRQCVVRRELFEALRARFLVRLLPARYLEKIKILWRNNIFLRFLTIFDDFCNVLNDFWRFLRNFSFLGFWVFV